MVNLLGDLWFPEGAAAAVEPAWSEVVADPDARLHLYGKAVPRPGRKMGHLTVLGDDVDEVAASAVALRQRLSSKPIESGSPPPATME
jgi:5-(carboxyamino)imidazole ribonucleotide synthase